MHQRHVHHNDVTAAVKESDDGEMESLTTTATNTIRAPSSPSKKFKRRKQQQQGLFWWWWPIGNKSRKRRVTSSNYAKSKSSSSARTTFSPSLDKLMDLDMLATFLQVFSVLIMMGCIVTLLVRAMTNDDYSDEGTIDDHRMQQHHHHHGGGGPFPPQSSSSSSWWHVLDIFGLFHDGRDWMSSHFPPNHPYGVGLNAKYPKVPLLSSSIYTIPGSMAHLGDKSDHYAMLRKEFDTKESSELPQVTQRYNFETMTMDANDQAVPYDIHNCPDEPPTGYPYAWNLMDVLKAWPPDDTTPRPQIFQGLCVFQYPRDLQKAYNYREAELPFVVQGDPEVYKAVQRWNSPKYLHRMLGKVRHRTEYSESNHFLYWNPPPRGRAGRPKHNRYWKNNGGGAPQDWKQPTEMMRMTYDDWLDHANVTDDSLVGPDMPHWYFRLIGCGETGPEGQCDNGSSEYLFDELTFFQPKDSLYMVEPEEQKGIHCRFGMKGVIAENHFDGSRNAIVVLGGERRYILSHPDQCPYLSLLPKGHPSARHSAVDWSNPDLEAYPEFGLAKGNEVVLQAGDVLYLPTNWFHFIVSLSLNYQCNTRSGISPDYNEPIHHCGF